MPLTCRIRAIDFECEIGNTLRQVLTKGSISVNRLSKEGERGGFDRIVHPLLVSREQAIGLPQVSAAENAPAPMGGRS
jgi:hypothetical protein